MQYTQLSCVTDVSITQTEDEIQLIKHSKTTTEGNSANIGEKMQYTHHN